MKVLGSVQEIAFNGLLLVRAKVVPRNNALVVDQRMREIGRIVRIYGPVKRPFAAIEPDDKSTRSLLSLIGKDVYIKEVDIDAKAKKDRRK